MESTLWFWIMVVVLLLIFLFLLKKYLGRIFLILLFCFVLFFVYKRISPNGAGRLRLAIRNIPVATTNVLNRVVLKNDIQLPLASDLPVQADLNLEEEPVEEKVSWFARLFGKKKKADWALEESLPNWESFLTWDQLLTGEILLPQEEVNVIIEQEEVRDEFSEAQNSTIETDLEVFEDASAEEEIIYIKSTPKPMKKAQTSSSSSELSAEDLEEARAIFGN